MALRVALKLARRAGKWHGAPEAILPVGFKADYLPRNRFLRIEELEKLLHELVPEHAARVAFIVATSANWRESELALRGDVAEDFSTVLLRSATRCSPIFASRTAVPVQQTCSKLLQVLHSLHLLHPLSPLNQRARRELNPRPSDSKCIQEPSTGLFSPSQGLTIDNKGSGVREVIHSNPSSASQTLAEESKIFAALVLHDPGVRARSAGNALLTVREVAAILRVCRDTVYRLCANGQLPHVRILNAIRIGPADLDGFLSLHRHGPKGVV